MKERPKAVVRRRDLFGLALAGAGAVVAEVVTAEPAAAKSVDLKDKRRPRYQANSAEVRNFYRVNAYPAR
ncbi:MAG: formate dehydrogenase [Bradyrhizobium sp.]